MKRLFEFKCTHEHVTERLIDDSVRTAACKDCGEDAVRIVSMPRINLEGITGAFPGAYESWSRKREQKLQQERKASYHEGT